MAQDWDEDDPHDMVYVSDEFAEEQEMRDQTMINQGMEQLRTAAGAEDEEEGMTAKLLRMIGFGDDEEGEEAAPVMTDEETMEFIRMEQEREE
jgi:hypothetical protein